MNAFVHGELKTTFLNQCFLQVLDHLSHIVIVLDAAYRPLVINDSGLKVLEEADGLKLSAGKFEITASETREKFKEILHQLTQSNHTGTQRQILVLPRPSGKIPYQCFVTGLSDLGEHTMKDFIPAYALFIFDPEDEQLLSVSQLQDLYGLTHTESRLAIMLSRGLSLTECAEKLGHKVSTSRNILKTIFSKTLTNRQHELTALLLKHAVPPLNVDVQYSKSNSIKV